MNPAQTQLAIPLLLAKLRYRCASLGWPAVLAVVLLCAAAGVEWSNRAMDGKIIQLRATQSELLVRLAARPEVKEERQRLASLPDSDSLSPVISALHKGAQQMNVQLSQGEYRLQPEVGTGLARYRISFPAKGNYPQLRGWLGAALTQQPGLILESLELKRDNIGTELLDAKIRLVLLVRKE